MADYGEIICNAVDEIVTAKLQGLQYDITKLCTIVDDSMSHQGKYVVSDGTARYEAFTTDVSFKSGNQVQVTIPNGDYTMQKTIVGRISTIDTTPFNYVSPLDTMIKITNNIFDNSKTQYGENSGLLANGEITLIGPIYSLEGRANLDGYTRLGLSANFRSWLGDLDVVSGSYGIKVLIYTNQVIEAGSQPTNVVYELNFDSSDMIGNPYQFEDYFYQEKCFDISNISNISKLEVYFYQNSNFKDGVNNLISHQMKDSMIDGEENPPINKPNNLFVNDVKIFLGYEIGTFTDETLMLYTPNSLTYRYNKEEVKEVDLRWIHKIDEQTFELLNQTTFDDKKYEIHWFKYNAKCEKINQYAGKDWEELDNKNEFYLYFTPSVKNQTEQIKIVGLIKGIKTEEGLKTATPYFSNIITFENEVLVPDQTTLNAATALSIRCLDNSEGNYLIYDQNGKIINEGVGRGYTRQFEVLYQGASINNTVNVNWIKWYFPKNKATMLVTTDEMYKVDTGKKTQEILFYKGVDYIEILREKNDNKIPATTQRYAIDNYWNINKSNNTVICKVNINGVEYQALEELHFGKAGTNGTDLTFCLEFDGNDNALIMKNYQNMKSTAIVRAHLYANSSSETSIGFPNGSVIKWSWHSVTQDKQYITIVEEGDQTDTTYVKLECNVLSASGVPSDNYYILKAELILAGGGQKLEAYLPIPIKHKDCAYIEGAKEIIYDYQGNPRYYNQPYVAYTLNKNGEYQEMTSANWNINYKNNPSINNNGLKPSEKGYLPQLNVLYTKNGVAYKNLVAPNFYLAGYNEKICVFCHSWSQPLLVMQSKYDLAMLNEWDGKLTLNEDNGTILSTMLGAGRKDKNNTFSGVLIGNVQAGTDKDDFETLTGVYGLHEGAISYALKEDGTAVFGKKGKGQIKIDGNGGTIESSSFISSGQGTKINLNDGIIDIKWPGTMTNGNNNTTGRILLQPESPYLYLNSTDNTTLLHIGDDASYLQSNNNTATKGTKLDLSNGTLNIRSTKSQFLISGDGSPYFKMGIPSDETDKAYANSLFLLDDNNYYLKSKDYKETEYIKVHNYNTYNEPSNPVVSISKTVAIDDEGNVYPVNGNDLGDSYVFSEIKNENKEISQTAEQVKQTYIAQLLPNLKSTTAEKGFKLDLNNSIINGYDLYLKGTNTFTKETFILDSSEPAIPFRIGDKFSVAWDGTTTCLKLNSLSNDGTSNNAISINNNFYVTKSGGAGGSGASWTGSHLGGTFSGTGSGIFKGTGNFDTLTVGGRTFIPRYNVFVTRIASIIPTTKIIEGVAVLTGFKLTYETLGGYYLGEPLWKINTKTLSC